MKKPAKKAAIKRAGKYSARRGRRSPTSRTAIASAEKQAQALELRRDGHTLQQIADALGFAGPSGAADCVQRALRATVAEPAEELRILELARLDSYLAALQKKIGTGEPRAIEVALRVSTRRAKLLGLDAPTQMRVEASAADRGVDLSGLSTEDLLALEAILKRAEASAGRNP
ncbi:MAG TPA: hypothetical protein VM425_12125 [Myxococcota bacterium]|nr:hypothetical protein [Myxococcota bacterium]